MANDEKHYTVWSNGQKIGDVYEEPDHSDKIKDRQRDMAIQYYQKQIDSIDRYIASSKAKREAEERLQKMFDSLSEQDRELLSKETKQLSDEIDSLERQHKLECAKIEKKEVVFNIILCLLAICCAVPVFGWVILNYEPFKFTIADLISLSSIFSIAFCAILLVLCLAAGFILKSILYILSGQRKKVKDSEKRCKELSEKKDELCKKR